MLNVCAAFVSLFSDDIRIGMRLPLPVPWIRILLLVSDIDVWLWQNCTAWIGLKWWCAWHGANLHVIVELRMVDDDLDISTNSYNVWCDSSRSNDFCDCDCVRNDWMAAVPPLLLPMPTMLPHFLVGIVDGGAEHLRRGLCWLLLSKSDVTFSQSISSFVDFSDACNQKKMKKENVKKMWKT